MASAAGSVAFQGSSSADTVREPQTAKEYTINFGKPAFFSCTCSRRAQNIHTAEILLSVEDGDYNSAGADFRPPGLPCLNRTGLYREQVSKLASSITCTLTHPLSSSGRPWCLQATLYCSGVDTHSTSNAHRVTGSARIQLNLDSKAITISLQSCNKLEVK